MDNITNGWFSEINDLWPGQANSLKIKRVLYHQKSDYQDVMVLETTNHGKALILDGIIQCTERDEFVYQEMIAFLPLCSHPKPSKVLIVGGGDGGVAREVTKHPDVTSVIQVEIDEKVVDASKQYLPFMSKGFDSPKLSLHIGDGFQYLRDNKSQFDVIITDSSDPIGPAVNLFTADYFQLLDEALKPGGVVCSQAGTVWYDIGHIRKTIERCSRRFGEVRLAVANVPTYPTGQIAFVVGKKGSSADGDLRVPVKCFSKVEIGRMELKFYNDEVHKAAFVLPNFVKSGLDLDKT